MNDDYPTEPMTPAHEAQTDETKSINWKRVLLALFVGAAVLLAGLYALAAHAVANAHPDELEA